MSSTSQGALAQGFAQMLFLFTSQAINEAYSRAIIRLCHQERFPVLRLSPRQWIITEHIR